MPIIHFDGPVLTVEQKARLASSFTKISSEVTQMPEQSFIVLIEERNPENVGVGGTLLSAKKRD